MVRTTTSRKTQGLCRPRENAQHESSSVGRIGTDRIGVRSRRADVFEGRDALVREMSNQRKETHYNVTGVHHQRTD